MARIRRVVEVSVPWLVGLFYLAVVADELAGAAPVAIVAGSVLALVQGGALSWRHTRPEPSAAIVITAALGYQLLVPEIIVPLAAMVAVFSLARARPPRISLVGLAGLLVVGSVNFFTSTVDDAVFTMLFAVSAWALGEAARSRRVAIEESAQRAVRDEQARIARELHDVIAHTVSTIVVQATAANDVFDARPEQARAALRSIESAGRDALGELRRVLGAVRPDVDAAPPPPQPRLDRVDDLAEPLRAAGLAVTVAREGPPTTLPAGVELSAYRIVQEALTNTLRHARATAAEVTFRYGPDAVEIDVVDDGRGAGFGLLGMRERAAQLGGTLEAGPTAHGGFRVHARLPLEVTP